jgi:hypothetical protein
MLDAVDDSPRFWQVICGRRCPALKPKKPVLMAGGDVICLFAQSEIKRVHVVDVPGEDNSFAGTSTKLWVGTYPTERRPQSTLIR